VGRKVDVDDLLDAGEVAELLGLASRNVVNVYRGRYPDFPAPVVERKGFRLWLRADVEAWTRTEGDLTRSPDAARSGPEGRTGRRSP
jgi:predicted DNA-binding transcriptional regulator AlpA